MRGSRAEPLHEFPARRSPFCYALPMSSRPDVHESRHRPRGWAARVRLASTLLMVVAIAPLFASASLLAPVFGAGSPSIVQLGFLHQALPTSELRAVTVNGGFGSSADGEVPESGDAAPRRWTRTAAHAGTASCSTRQGAARLSPLRSSPAAPRAPPSIR
jgi:hypothetical protein